MPARTAPHFGESSSSRPGSGASSTNTDLLGAPRPLLRDIDHIKSLISRASISAKPNDSSITAQVFRRAAPQQPVSQTQILVELDALRRRIKYETHRPRLEPELEDVDPETDTDDEFHDAFADIEIESVDDQLRRARQQKEHIVEDAEARVDQLSDENGRLRQQLDTLRSEHELSKEQDAKRWKDDLADSQDQLRTLNDQYDALRTSSAEELVAKVESMTVQHEAQIRSLRDGWDAERERAEAQHQSSLAQAIEEATATAIRTDSATDAPTPVNDTSPAPTNDDKQPTPSQKCELQSRIERLTMTNEDHQSARRHLEGMLQEKTHEAIQAVEERKSRERNIIALEQELAALNKKHERTEHTLRELQETVEEHETLALDQTSRVNSELREFKKQVLDAQEERKTVQSDIDAKMVKQSELASQNDFLTKQLAALSEQMNQPRQPKAEYISAGIQTSPRIQVIASPRHSPHQRTPSMSAELTSPVCATRSSIAFGPELNSNASGSPLARQVLSKETQPQIPNSPDLKPKRWSLQDYIERQSPDELPSTITANEALLAEKFREHVGALQQARDQLARQFQERFDSLLADKKRSEKQVTLEQAADFVRDREQLASRFTANEKQAASDQELHTAEQRLVQQYHKRLAKHKSQIRLKHAEDFHTMTQDYDQRLQDLLHQQSEIESDLFGNSRTGDNPRQPHQSHEDTNTPDREQTTNLNVVAADLNRNTSRLPRRTPTGMRTTSLIPRVSSQSELRDDLPLSQPQLQRKSSGDVRAHSPVKQRSLLRMKSPPDVPTGKRSFTDLHAEMYRQTSNEHLNDRRLEDPASIDMHGKAVRRQSASPNFKATLGAQRTLSSSSDLQRTVLTAGGRSKRHSSGIYYNKLRAAT